MNQKAFISLFHQKSCQEEEQQSTSAWPKRCAAGKKEPSMKEIGYIQKFWKIPKICMPKQCRNEDTFLE